MTNNRQTRIIFLLALSVVTIWFCYVIARPFLKPVFMACVLAIVFYPVHTRLHKLIRPPNVAALLSTLLVLLLLIIPAVLLGAAIQREIAAAYQSLNPGGAQDGSLVPGLLKFSEKLNRWLSRFIGESRFDLRAAIQNQLQQISAALLSGIAGLVGNLTSFVVDSVTTFFTLFFLFRDGRTVRRRLMAILPLRPDQVEKLTGGVSRTIVASMYGGLAVALAQGMLISLAFWVLSVPSPILWGLVTALFSFVPIIGSAAVWVPIAIILMFSGHLIKGLLLLAWGAGVVGMADNVVRPLVISEQVKFYPLYIFFALLGGMQAFGLAGLFVGPVVLAIALALFSLWREENHPQCVAAHISKEQPVQSAQSAQSAQSTQSD
jgi:predicted PurR-regulated permease PerM